MINRGATSVKGKNNFLSLFSGTIVYPIPLTVESVHAYSLFQRASRKPIRSALACRLSPSPTLCNAPKSDLLFLLNDYCYMIFFLNNTKRAPIHKGRETRGATFLAVITATHNSIRATLHALNTCLL